MKHDLRAGRSIAGLLLLTFLIFPPDDARGQGYGGPLTMQGIDQQPIHSAAARAFGGVTTRSGDAGLMFTNAAALHGLQGIHVSIAGYHADRNLRQEQNYAPVRYYPNLSLLLEDRTDELLDPDPSLPGFTPADSVQRPFDDIGPNWSNSSSGTLPLHAFVAAPFSAGNLRLVAGAGYVRYADLSHYYQNNNVLSPSVLAQRPLPLPRPTDDAPLTAAWYQATRSREGSIHGYGAALATNVESLGLTVGLSGLVLSGTSDDVERRVNRGTLTFLANSFRAEESAGGYELAGTSDYSGFELGISGSLQSQYVTASVAVKVPTTITRTFSLADRSEHAGNDTGDLLIRDGEEKMQLPWRGTIGLLLEPFERMDIGIEYEFRPYASATFTDVAGIETNPWYSADLFRVGAQYDLAPWLTIRGGIRGDAAVFVPEGSALVETPVAYRVFSAGVGFHFRGIEWDLTYEGSNMKYEDSWASALSLNSQRRHTIITGISYTLRGFR